MHRRFLEILADPITGESLDLEVVRELDGRVVEGALRSSSNRFPIVRGVPRFAGYQDTANYSKSFGYQWNRWRRVQFESENQGGPMEGHTRSMWEKITDTPGDLPAGSVVGDFGCGPGRFVEVARKKGARVIGLDLSDAVEAAAENFRDDPEVLICQADVLRPPIRHASLDLAFSIGVLHHTPDPMHGVAALSSCLKAGGKLAVCVYGRGGFYDFPTVTIYRKLFKLLWPILGAYPPLAYAYASSYGLRPIARIPYLGKALRAVIPFINLADPRWSVLDTFDAVTPTHQSTHDSFEVYRWLRDQGLLDIRPSDWGFTTYTGIKPRN